MIPFRNICITYLLMHGWEQDEDGWAWTYRQGYVHRVQTDDMCEALKYQLEWDDEGAN